MEETKPEAPTAPQEPPVFPAPPEPPESPAPQEPPPAQGEKTPADLALERDGGEIVPEGFSAKGEPAPLDFDKLRPVVEEVGPPPPEAPDSPAQHVIDVQQGSAKAGPAPPGVEPLAPPSPEQQAFVDGLNASINLETNVYHACYGAVHNVVNYLIQSQPQDSAELGQSLFGAGVRSPLEQAEPQIAMEVYRQVRENMREDEKARQEALRGRGLLRKVLGALFGR